VALVRSVKTETVSVSTFTPEQVRALVVRSVGDWKGLILAGFFTGARLMDLARLEWSNVSGDFIQFRQGKTGGFVQIPIHAELQEWFKCRVREKFVFPTLAAKGQTVLSFEFARIVDRAGIEVAHSRQAQGRGRSRRSLTFHSLRHSFTSALANAGVPEEVRQKLTGHKDSRSHQFCQESESNFLHLKAKKIRKWAKKLAWELTDVNSDYLDPEDVDALLLEEDIWELEYEAERRMF
jgi:integrase